MLSDGAFWLLIECAEVVVVGFIAVGLWLLLRPRPEA